MKHVDMMVKAPFFYTMQGEGVGCMTGVVMRSEEHTSELQSR